ncbi:MAG: prephenate dehydratase [Cyclobacteriaceae bacterium]|nr:prephenate dehydratase [Cyclobacteriaceae bacterium HetDA_MAG_MS6]
MLDELRKGIDEIDDQLIDLLNQRMKLVKKVGDFKRTNQASIYRPEREKAIIDRLASQSKGPLTRSAIEALFLEIFAVSRNYELPERIAYLGPQGSFTHQAAESRYGSMSEYLSLASISSVFEAVQTTRARFGVIPVENNQEGTVQETIDLLGEHQLSIAAEIVLPIHFAFASKAENLTNIKKIYSKDIAFRQCKKFLKEFFGDEVTYVPVNSTSSACRMAIEEEGAAAICSHIAARQYQLPILYDNIEDSGDNHTRFLIISKDFVNQRSGNDKSSILARLPDQPGALASFLQEFHQAGINLCKVESRPAKIGSQFKYFFFIDFDGHFEDEKVSQALNPYLDNLTWLGSYVKMC